MPEAAPPVTAPKRTLKRDQFGKFIEVVEDTVGENLVEFKVHNPLKRFYAFLDYIKTHGKTTFTFRVTFSFLTITAVGMSVVGIVGVTGWTLSRISKVCPTRPGTHIGRLYILPVELPAAKSLVLFDNPLTGIPRPILATQAVLREENQTLTLIMPSGTDLTLLKDQTVAVTGQHNLCDSTLTVTSTQNVSVLSP